MSIDYAWQSNGGILLDSSGDILVTSPLTQDCLIDMVRTRVKAALNAWRLYSIGADLESRVGDLNTPETAIKVQRQILDALALNFLPKGTFQVQTLPDGTTLYAVVYLGSQPLVSVTLSPSGFLVN